MLAKLSSASSIFMQLLLDDHVSTTVVTSIFESKKLTRFPSYTKNHKEELQNLINGLQNRTDQTRCPLLETKDLREQLTRRARGYEQNQNGSDVPAQHETSSGIGKKRPRSPSKGSEDLHADRKRQTLLSGHFPASKNNAAPAQDAKSSDGLVSGRPKSSDGLASAKAKPALISYQLKNLVEDGFGIPSKLAYNSRPWPISWELTRAISVKRITERDAQKIETYDELKAKLSQSKKAKNVEFGLSSAAAFVAQTDNTHDSKLEAPQLTLSGTITLNKTNKGPLFKTTLAAIKPDKHCRAQRKWGWDRLLYVTLVVSPTPDHLVFGDSDWNDLIVSWLTGPHTLLGRTWRAFHVEDYKKRQSRRTKNVEDFGVKRVVFFATDGVGLTPKVFTTFLDWMLPFEFNEQQSVCKAAARYDLPLSRTRSTIVFKLDQIHIVDDVLPSSIENQMPFQDPDIKHNRPLRAHDPVEAMTDGCGIISVGAAREICTILRINSYPSAFQARIFGSKGMWIVSDRYDTSDEHHLDTWIKIRKSQLKVKHGNGTDIHERYKYDWTLRSFDINRWSLRATTSDIHRDFLAILVERGVKIEAIMKIVAQSLEEDTATMLEACNDAEELAILLQRSGSTLAGLSESDGLPKLRHERLMYFLARGGFLPTQCEYMSKLYKEHCCQLMLDDVERLRFHCEESTMLFGVPDPTGKLEPGQIHVSFSGALKHGGQRNIVKDLAGRQVIVARDPTLRPSDMQKYDCVYCVELAHLQDVVVFSSKGNMPAAARHQGGDYDGDTFVLLWSKPLVEDFMNVPVYEPKPAEQLGVVRKKEKLGELVARSKWGTEAHCREFVRQAFKFRLNENLLGRVTNFFYAITYQDESISSDKATDLADLHDLLVDSLKQGYVFGADDFSNFMMARGLIKPAMEPAYKSSIAILSHAIESERNLPAAFKRICVHEAKRTMDDSTPILDRVYFDVKLPYIGRAINSLEDALNNAIDKDQGLLQPMQYFAKSYKDDFVKEVLQDIEKELKIIDGDWSLAFADRDNTRLNYMQAAIDKYRNITPPKSLCWMEYEKREDMITPWDRLCASFFYDWTYKTGKADWKSTRLFRIAGRALCDIKSTSTSGRDVVKEVASLQRIKRVDRSKPISRYGLQIGSTPMTEADEYGAPDEFDLGPEFFEDVNLDE
ncbi:hypothetical protein MRB53_041249 [Persea americana]|nr:hypothetical protein MRB53_041249 [Persea americana]